MLIAFYALLGLLLLLALFFTLLHPLLCIVDCAFSKEQSISAKIVWIVATLFTGFIAAIAYTLFGTKSSWLRRSTRNAFGLGVVCVAMVFGVTMVSPEAKGLISKAAGDPAGTELGASSESLSIGSLTQQPGQDLINTSSFDATLENLSKQIEQLAQQETGTPAKDLTASQSDDDSVPPGRAIATQSHTQSGNRDETKNEKPTRAEALGNIAVGAFESYFGDTPDQDSELDSSPKQRIASILEDSIAELQDSLDEETTAQASSSDEGSQHESFPAPPVAEVDDTSFASSKESASTPGPADAAPARAAHSNTGESQRQANQSADNPLGQLRPQQKLTEAKQERSRATPTELEKPTRIESSAKTSSKDTPPFNRYRGTSEPLKLDFQVPPVRNRYINP